jgi:SpoVK/Ycf46/Vps4 family AAA+-type ATPase
LLFGPPGNGKSYAIRKLAEAFGVTRVATFDFSHAAERPDTALREFMLGAAPVIGSPGDPAAAEESGPLRFVLFEDLDRHFAQGGPPATPISLSGLLNALQGCEEPTNTVVFITANTPEILEQRSVLRFGRVDLHVNFAAPTTDELCAYLNHRWPGTLSPPARTAYRQTLSGHSFATAEEVYKRAGMRAFVADAELAETHLLAALEDLQRTLNRGLTGKAGAGFGHG